MITQQVPLDVTHKPPRLGRETPKLLGIEIVSSARPLRPVDDPERRRIGLPTIANTYRIFFDPSRDQVAVDHIMGHARDDMASRYRERISDERLRAITDTVHHWLSGGDG